MTKEIKKLKSWLNKPENSAARLAAELGYESSQTILQWISRGKIPSYQIKKVMEVIDK